jgi:hypothetical protein
MFTSLGYAVLCFGLAGMLIGFVAIVNIGK